MPGFTFRGWVFETETIETMKPYDPIDDFAKYTSFLVCHLIKIAKEVRTNPCYISSTDFKNNINKLIDIRIKWRNKVHQTKKLYVIKLFHRSKNINKLACYKLWNNNDWKLYAVKLLQFLETYTIFITPLYKF